MDVGNEWTRGHCHRHAAPAAAADTAAVKITRSPAARGVAESDTRPQHTLAFTNDRCMTPLNRTLYTNLTTVSI